MCDFKKKNLINYNKKFNFNQCIKTLLNQTHNKNDIIANFPSLKAWVPRSEGTSSSNNLRATASVCANFLSILQEKTYFFYFTHLLLQNTHISLSILHIYSIKHSFFLHFFIISFPLLSRTLSQTQNHQPPSTIK